MGCITKTDKTLKMKIVLSIALVASLCAGASISPQSQVSRPVQSQIQPTANSHWGDWGQESFCPDNTWAKGFKLKVEPDQGDILDDSSLNGVQLSCFNRQDVFQNTASSTVGEQGDWKSEQFCGQQGAFINGARFRSKAPSVSLDETAGNNVDFKCTNGQTLSGDGLYWGDWSTWVTCPSGTAVCGIKTKVDPYGGTLKDDTGLNEILLDCCRL